MNKENISSFLLKAGLYSAALTCFFIPLSTSLLAAFSGLAFLFWVLSGRCLNLKAILAKYPQAALALILLVLFLLGLLYTPENLGEALDNLKKYRELIFMLMVLSLFHGKPREARLALNCFAAGLMVLMLISYLIFFGFMTSMQTAVGDSHIHHITHSFFMAVLAFWSLHKFSAGSKFRYLWLPVFLLASANLALVTPGRTGMMVYVLLIILYLWQRLSAKVFFLAAAFLCLIMTGIYYKSDNVSSRLQKAVSEVQNYQPGIARTSMGMRLDWYQNSVELIRQKPLLGHGTGSFAKVQGQIIKGTWTAPTDNPHNEYLLIGVQLGLVGLTVFMAVFSAQLFCSFKLPEYNRNMLQGMVISMMTGCLMNSFLFDSMQGHFYAFITALLFSSGQESG